MSLLRSWFASLLPERSRRALDPGQGRGPTLMTGLIEMAGGVTLGVTGLMAFRLEYYRRTLEAGFPGGDLDQMFGYGAVLYLSFLLTVRGLLALLLFVEGGIRVLSAVYVEEPCPSLVASGLDALIRRWRGRRRQPARPETVVAVADRLILETDRRRDWDAETTVGHDGTLYWVEDSAEPTPGRFRYRLAPVPERHVIRNVRTIVGP